MSPQLCPVLMDHGVHALGLAETEDTVTTHP